jgi:hypothetical protein
LSVGLQGPCVLFATPGMLHGGTSLEVFKAWAPDPNNLVLLPSYQVGTRTSRTLTGLLTPRPMQRCPAVQPTLCIDSFHWFCGVAAFSCRRIYKERSIAM